MNAIKKYNINNFVHKELKVTSTDEKLSFSAVLSATCDFKDVFIVHEILLPGRKDSAPHCHARKEEMIFVLAGNPILHVGNHGTCRYLSSH